MIVIDKHVGRKQRPQQLPRDLSSRKQRVNIMLQYSIVLRYKSKYDSEVVDQVIVARMCVFLKLQPLLKSKPVVVEKLRWCLEINVILLDLWLRTFDKLIVLLSCPCICMLAFWGTDARDTPSTSGLISRRTLASRLDLMSTSVP